MNKNKLSVLRPDPASPTPLYLQIANKLTMAIQAGYWLANQPLPSERALVEAFGISRVTARKALEVLEQEGRIQRRPGSGSYITPRLEQPLARQAPAPMPAPAPRAASGFDDMDDDIPF